jgi:glycosyltransferase involved in cell wall biosynthesis
MWRLFKIAWCLRKAKANILLPYTLVPNTICGMLWRFSGARLCIWNQRDEGIEGHWEPFESWAIRLTPLFVANSNSCAEFVTQNLNVDKNKVSVVPNGVALAPPVDSRTVWRQRLGLTASAICVGMIANISDKKDHPTLLKAWSEVVAYLSPAPGQLLLVLAGSHKGNSKGLIDLVTSLNLSEYVTFLGPVMDVSGLLEAIDIGVYSSVSEGLPNGVLECMAMGKAIVATRIPGISAALGDDYTLLSQPGVPAEMAAYLINLINNSEMRQRIGQQNLERAIACFDSESMCKKMIKIIEDNLERCYD